MAPSINHLVVLLCTTLLVTHSTGTPIFEDLYTTSTTCSTPTSLPGRAYLVPIGVCMEFGGNTPVDVDVHHVPAATQTAAPTAATAAPTAAPAQYKTMATCSATTVTYAKYLISNDSTAESNSCMGTPATTTSASFNSCAGSTCPSDPTYTYAVVSNPEGICEKTTEEVYTMEIFNTTDTSCTGLGFPGKGAALTVSMGCVPFLAAAATPGPLGKVVAIQLTTVRGNGVMLSTFGERFCSKASLLNTVTGTFDDGGPSPATCTQATVTNSSGVVNTLWDARLVKYGTPTNQCVPASHGVEYVGTPSLVLKDVGSPQACCDVCLVEGCVAWSVRSSTNSGPAGKRTCTLYNTTNAIAATSGLIASGHQPGIPTHYMNPYTHDSCLPGEINLTVATLGGRWCSAACANSTPCPLDTPDNVSATPSCEIHDPVGTGTHCALTCTTSDECGPTLASVCDLTFTPGICTYSAPSPTVPPTAPPTYTPGKGWALGDTGISCAAACTSLSKTCSPGPMTLVQSEATFKIAGAACAPDCSEYDESEKPIAPYHEASTCYFRSSGIAECETKPGGISRLCCCVHPGEDPTTACPV